MSKVFDQIVQGARMKTLACIEDIGRIADGTMTASESKFAGGEWHTIDITPTLADRMSAFKLLKDIVMNKEAMSISNEEELDMMSPYERKKLYLEALEEVQEEIESLQ